MMNRRFISVTLILFRAIPKEVMSPQGLADAPPLSDFKTLGAIKQRDGLFFLKFSCGHGCITVFIRPDDC